MALDHVFPAKGDCSQVRLFIRQHQGLPSMKPGSNKGNEPELFRNVFTRIVLLPIRKWTVLEKSALRWSGYKGKTFCTVLFALTTTSHMVVVVFSK
jgi:hypothetical protein